MIKTVTYPIKDLKAPDSKGVFEAWVAETFPEDAPKSKADADGDIFTTGAFDIQDGEKVSVYYQHDYSPTSEVGEAILEPLKSRDVLPASGRLFVGQGKPIAEGVYESMLLSDDDPSALKEFSVGYDVDPEDVFYRKDGVRIIRKSKVLEISVVYKGAQKTELVSVKAGREISAKNEAKLREAMSIISSVLASLEKIEEPEKESKSPPWHVEERDGEFCVLLDEDGSTVKCHPTREMAEAHMAALYANEGKEAELESKPSRKEELLQKIRLLTMDVA